MAAYLLPLISLIAGCGGRLGWDIDHDEDGDGYTYDKDNDCNDYDRYIHPDAEEILADQVDQNCNGHDDEDMDADGQTVLDGDCDDTDPSIFPGAIEFATDLVDNDCDSQIDESNDLTNFVTFMGSVGGDFSGTTFAGGDSDGDGLSDLSIGSPEASRDEEYMGVVSLIYGSSSVWSNENSLMNADDEIVGPKKYDRLGSSQTICDMDGDGMGEWYLGAKGYDVSGTSEGGILDSEGNVLWWGNEDNANAGASLFCAGNVNSGEDNDLLVGAPGTGGSRGTVYLLWGSTYGGPGTGDLSSAASQVWIGESEDDRFGFSLAGGHDVNGDGFDDVIVGAPGNSTNGISAGAAYLFLGDGNPSESPDAVFLGEADYDQAGYAVGLVPDNNGDGFDEILVSAPWYDGEARDTGRGYLVLGGLNLASINLSQADRILSSTEEGEELGLSVASVGDINHDELGDFALGSLSDSHGEDAGAVYLFLGALSVPALIDATSADVLFFGQEGDHAYVVAGVGNVNGRAYEYDNVPSYDDFAIGAPYALNEAGKTYLLFGQATRE